MLTNKWWNYKRFQGDNVKVLLVSLRHLLLKELSLSLIKLGHSSQTLLIGETALDRNLVEQRYTEAIRNFEPDFVLTVNHLGFDQEGVVTDLLTHFKVPFASWYVDSPHLIIHHYFRNKSPYLSLFLWDRDYIDIIKRQGFKNVEYLPLGVDESLFKPLNGKQNALTHLSSDISFAGNSMVFKVSSVLRRNNIQGLLLENLDKVAIAFEQSTKLIVRDIIEEQFPELVKDLNRLSSAQIYGYEAAVTWQATCLYRLKLVKRLQPFSHLIIGDPGWERILGQGFRLHRELNYYQELNSFYNMSRINFNATSRQMKNGINQRIFDVPASGGVVLTDHTLQLETLMEPGRDLLTYHNEDEIPDLIDKTLKDPQFHKKIAESGKKRVLNEHTYSHRLENLIKVMKRNYA